MFNSATHVTPKLAVGLRSSSVYNRHDIPAAILDTYKFDCSPVVP